MHSYFFTVFEVDSSYYYSDARSPVLSKDTLEITDGGDGELDPTRQSDDGKDQIFSFANENEVANYKVQYLDYAQVNGSGTEFELYAMKVNFKGGPPKYYVMSKDDNFNPEVGDDLRVTSFSTFTTTDYGQMGSAVCYTPGIRIRTPRGARPVEHLRAGDLVQTKDNGCREILWIGTRRLGPDALRRFPRLRPVLIAPGVLGAEAPLLVSPQHRLLVTPERLGAALPCPEAYVTARHLSELAGGGARVAHGKREVTYIHLLLAQHEVLFANGAESESLFPGPMALSGISRAERAEIEALFPDLPETDAPAGTGGMALARPMVPQAVLKPLRGTRARPGGDLGGAGALPGIAVGRGIAGVTRIADRTSLSGGAAGGQIAGQRLAT